MHVCMRSLTFCKQKILKKNFIDSPIKSFKPVILVFVNRKLYKNNFRCIAELVTKNAMQSNSDLKSVWTQTLVHCIKFFLHVCLYIPKILNWRIIKQEADQKQKQKQISWKWRGKKNIYMPIKNTFKYIHTYVAYVVHAYRFLLNYVTLKILNIRPIF